jgi:hypothetical protein
MLASDPTTTALEVPTAAAFPLLTKADDSIADSENRALYRGSPLNLSCRHVELHDLTGSIALALDS